MGNANDNNESENKKKSALEIIDNIIKLPKKTRCKTTTKAIPSNNIISGDGNIVGNGNVVNNIWNPTPEKRVIKVQTGVGVITSEQKAILKELVDEIVKIEGLVRKKPRRHPSVWSALNRRMKVTSYHEIPEGKFDAAHKSLLIEKARLNNTISAQKKSPTWRLDRYRAINARAKEFVDGESRYRTYAELKFGTSSLKELDDDQLNEVYHYVMSWKKEKIISDSTKRDLSARLARKRR